MAPGPPRRAAAAALLTIAASATAAAQQAPTPFAGVVDVTRIVTEVRVVDHDGFPVTGLTPGDFRVKVDGRPAEVESASWVPSTAGAASPKSTGAAPDDAVVASAPGEGRLIVVVVQTDLALRASRTIGLLKLAPQVRAFVASLGDSDRVALFTFGSHLELRSDFTDDHEAVAAMLAPTEVLEGALPAPDPTGPSLSSHLDRDEMRGAASMSRALELIGLALQPIEGTKSLVFVGFALGKMSAGPRVTVGDQYRRAMEALTAARTSVFALDICDADFHSLELGMRILSDDTGGFYIKTHIFPEIAVDKLARVISSYYELSIIPPDGTRDPYRIRIKVQRPRTEVHVRQYHPSSYRW
jgi:VWFA-related protein